jgi:drug/metabolite transporter (DMT)-like permease
MFLMPMIAVLAGAVLMGERLGAPAFAGMALILAGSVVVNGIGFGRSARARVEAQAQAQAQAQA